MEMQLRSTNSEGSRAKSLTFWPSRDDPGSTGVPPATSRSLSHSAPSYRPLVLVLPSKLSTDSTTPGHDETRRETRSERRLNKEWNMNSQRTLKCGKCSLSLGTRHGVKWGEGRELMVPMRCGSSGRYSRVLRGKWLLFKPTRPSASPSPNREFNIVYSPLSRHRVRALLFIHLMEVGIIIMF